MPKSRGTSPKELKRRLRVRQHDASTARRLAKVYREEAEAARRDAKELTDIFEAALERAGLELAWGEDWASCEIVPRKARSASAKVPGAGRIPA